MAEIAVKNTATGQIEYYPDGTDVAGLLREGRVQATPEDIDRRRTFLKNTETGAQAVEAGKMAANAATFGVFADDSPEAKQKQKDFSEASPTLSVVSKMVGAAAPALLAAPLASGAAAALGLSGRAAALGASVAEEVAGNTAFEMADAREMDRDISLPNIIIGTGLGTGISMAARAAKGGLKAFNAPKSEGILDAASSESQWLSKGRKVSGERRSVGAAGATETRAPATVKDVEAYAAAPEEFHAQVNRAAHDALTDAFTGHEGAMGTSGGAARQVHGLAFKEQDVLPHMVDLDPEVAIEAMNEHLQAFRVSADVLDSQGHKSAADRIRKAAAYAEEAASADPEMITARAATRLNMLKQEADRVYSGMVGTPGFKSKSAARELAKPLENIRKSLEQKATWGEHWAERQTLENGLWSGDGGIIQMDNMYMDTLFKKVKGKARVNVNGDITEVYNMTPHPDIAERVRDLKPIDAKKQLNAWQSSVEQRIRMTELKEEWGMVRNAGPDGEAAVDTLKNSLNQQLQVIEELRFIHEAAPRAKPILDKLAASGAAKAQGELIFDGVSELPGIGSVLKAADKAKKALTGKSIREGFMPEVLPPAREFDRAASLQAISERQAARGRRVVTPPTGPGGGPGFGQNTGGLGGPKGRGGDAGFGGQSSNVQIPVGHVPSIRQAPVNLKGKLTAGPKKFLEEAQGVADTALVGKDLKSLNALEGVNRETVDALKRDPTFLKTGNVKDNFGSSESGLPSFLIDTDGSFKLRNGRHRLTAAQELGMETIEGRILKYGPRGKEVWSYTGPIKIAGGAAVVGAGVLASGQAGATEHLAEISDNSRAITERAALGLTVKESRAPKLRPLAERFKDGAPDLNAAFRMKTAELRQIIEDPMSYVQGMTSAFGGIAQEHPGLFMQMVERTTVGAHYLQANLPPSVGISMVHPNGIAPDSLAVMKFAAMYNAVFSPGDVVYDVGTGDATPTQIRALREVHPDIYENLRTDVLKQISQVGQRVPFETLRGLDNLFDLPGVAGLAFSPAMTQTMAGAYADKETPPKQSLGGESSIAPDLASSKLAGLSAVK